MMNNNMKLKIGHTESPDNLTKAHRFRLTFSHSGILPQLIMFTKSALLLLTLLCTYGCLVIGWHSKLEIEPENGRQCIHFLNVSHKQCPLHVYPQVQTLTSMQTLYMVSPTLKVDLKRKNVENTHRIKGVSASTCER